MPKKSKLDLLVCYDVETVHEQGRKRLRRIAKACEAHGQRVQCSVFECKVTPVGYEKLLTRLLEEMDEEHDSLRIYFLEGSRDDVVKVFGRDGWTDFDAPLIV